MNAAERSFEEQLAAPSGGEPAFLGALRAAGRETFLRVRLPTLKHEDWRYTNLAPLAAQAWTPAAPARGGEVAELPPAPRLVFVNGRLDPEASDLAGLPPGVRLGSLATALRERPGDLEPLLGRVVTVPDHAFAALNAALFEDGALVEIADGVALDRPIHLAFLSTAVRPSAVHPRNLVVAGRGAQATVVEHDRIQEEDDAAFHVGLLNVRQAGGSRLVGQSVALGTQLARVEARALLVSEAASCDLHGLYVGAGRQVLDHFVHVDHASPRCTSREVFKGILDGSSRGVFAGRITVREGAQKTDAGQVNSNLLLSEDATVDTKPQLEILADDVKCSHGGSVGQIREDQLFYLRSRGIGEALARALLTWAFASDMVQRVGPEEVRARVRRAVTARLPSGALLREVA